jgi:hypothetical protein
MFSKITKENEIWTRDMYRFLEKSMGGHGNGVAYIHRNKQMAIEKGMEFTCQNCINEVVNNSVGGISLFHTRRASSGSVSSENCQPFFINPNKVLVHNGTWSSCRDWRKILLVSKNKEGKSYINIKEYLTFTDTKTIARMIDVLDDETFLAVVDSGIFVIYDSISNKARIYNYGGRFEITQKKGLYYYASEFDQIYKKHWKLDINSIIEVDIDGFKLLHGSITKKLRNNHTTYNNLNDFNRVGNGTTDDTVKNRIRAHVEQKREEDLLIVAFRDQMEKTSKQYHYKLQPSDKEPSPAMVESLASCSARFLTGYTLWVTTDKPLTLGFVENIVRMSPEEIFAYSYINDEDGYIMIFDDNGMMLYLIESTCPNKIELESFYADQFKLEG